MTSRSGRRLGRLGTALAGLLLAAGCGSPGGGAAGSSPGASATSEPAWIPPATTSAVVGGRWAPLPASPLPALTQVTGGWDGVKLLVVGTFDVAPGRPAGSAAGYDPVTGRWRVLPVPTGTRADVEGSPRSVWTGHDLVVWGGAFNEAYTPATNSWRHLPHPAGVPSGGGFAMVWTGSRVVLYGGGCCGAPDAGGAALDPTTDTWQALPPSPLGARWTTGAWTGTEVVVAGGVGPLRPSDLDPVPLATAAAWNPATRRWRPLPPMPAAGSGQAVWDGSRVLVIGPGISTAYTPATNSWAALPAGYDGRDGAGLAWTGRQLLVWGGHVNGRGTTTVPPHGLALDPAAGRWTGLSTSPLRGRYGPVAGWTGSQFLVWGGSGEVTGASWSP